MSDGPHPEAARRVAAAPLAAVGDAPAGSVTRGGWEIAEMPGGGAVELAFAVIRGAEDGPLAWIIGARDGDEVHATFIATEVLRRLRPESVAGTVVVIPVVNVPGFQVLSRSHPLAPSYLGEQLEGSLFAELTGRPGFVIDLHSAGRDAETADWTLHLAEDERASRMARAYCPKISYAHEMGSGSGPNAGLLDGALFVRLSKAGVPAILIEAGGGLPPNPSVISRGAAGVENVLRTIGVLRLGEIDPTPEPRPISNFRIVTPRTGGIVFPYTHLGKDVEEGELIGVVRDLFGETREEIRAPVAGIVLTMTQNPVVGTGSWAFEIGW